MVGRKEEKQKESEHNSVQQKMRQYFVRNLGDAFNKLNRVGKTKPVANAPWHSLRVKGQQWTPRAHAWLTSPMQPSFIMYFLT